MNEKKFAAAIEAALGIYGCSHNNPCGGTGYKDGCKSKPYRVLYGDGAACEYFASAKDAIKSAESYRDEMDRQTR